MWLIVIYFLFIGGFAGLMSGLLGVGGGIIVVPLLALVFKLQGFSENVVMHMAAGTSLAVMIFTTSRSMIAHLSYKIEFWSIAKQMLVPIVIGVVGGAICAHLLDTQTLRIIFACFLVVIALRMFLLKSAKTQQHNLPGLCGMSIAGVVVGGLSGLLGIGGGTTMIPFLTHFHVTIRKALLVAVSLSVIIAAVGAATFIVTGFHNPDLPNETLGYVYWPAWIVVSIGSMSMAPVGARFSHMFSTKVLKRIFAIFVMIVAIHMFWSI